MRHFKIMGLCLVAVFALSAVVASAASASLPAVYECAKTVKFEGKYTGHYTSKACSEASKVVSGGKYELREYSKGEAGKTFKGKGGGADLAIEGVATVACTSSTDTGKFSGPKTSNHTIATFKGCEIAGLKCNSAGAPTGTVVTKSLAGEVGYISGKGTEHPVVGVDLRPETGLYEAEFECADLHLRVSGSVIGEVIVPLKTFTKTVTFKFRESGGKQHPEEFEGGLPDTLITETCKGEGCTPGGTPDPSAEETEVTNKGESLELIA